MSCRQLVLAALHLAAYVSHDSRRWTLRFERYTCLEARERLGREL